MAPKAKNAALEAKIDELGKQLASKDKELQEAQAALTKAEASRAKLKQYLEAFRQQAVNTTQVITQFQQLQKDHTDLQTQHQNLKDEHTTLQQEHQQLKIDRNNLTTHNEQLQKDLRGLQAQQQQSGQKREQESQATGPTESGRAAGGAADVPRQRRTPGKQRAERQREREQALPAARLPDGQRAASQQEVRAKQDQDQELTTQVQALQSANGQLSAELAAVRQQQLQERQQREQQTQATAGTAGVASTIAASRRRVAGGAAAGRAERSAGREGHGAGPSVPEAVAAADSAAECASGNASDSDSGYGDGAKGGQTQRRRSGVGLRVQREREQRLAAEISRAEAQRRAAEGALAEARRQVEVLTRREEAQRVAMDELRAQLQALQALVAQQGATLASHTSHLTRHDDHIRRQDAHLAAQTAQLEEARTNVRQHAAQLGRLEAARAGDAAAAMEALGGVETRLGARLGEVEAGGAALRGRLEAMTATVRGVTRTHRILRAAFCGGSNDGIGGVHGGELVLWDGGAAAPWEEGGQGPAAQHGGALAAPEPLQPLYDAPAPDLGAAEAEMEDRKVEYMATAVPEALVAREQVAEAREERFAHRDKRQRLVGLGADGVGADTTRLAPALAPAPLKPVAAAANPLLGALSHELTQPSPMGALQPTLPASLTTRGVAAAGAMPSPRRRGPGRPPRERSPSELLATLLDGKATGQGQLAKIASAAARRAADAVRTRVLQPAPMATAICSAILRCCRSRVGVGGDAGGDGASAADSEVHHAAPRGPSAELERGAALEGLGSGDGGRRSGGVGAGGNGAGTLLQVLQPALSRSRAGDGFGGPTLVDALSVLWCRPVEQQRQLVRWLLLVARDMDLLLLAGQGRDVSVPGSGSAERAGPSDPEAMVQQGKGEGLGRRAVEEAGAQPHGGNEGGRVEEGMLMTALARNSVGSRSGEPVGGSGCPSVVGGLLARQLNNMVVSTWLDGTSVSEEERVIPNSGDGGGMDGAGGADAMPPPGSAATTAAAPRNLAEHSAAAAALGQLLRLYQDKDGLHCTALDMLHAVAEARAIHQLQTRYYRGANGSPQPGPSTSLQADGVGSIACHSPFFPSGVASTPITSLLPLACLLVSWPSSLLVTATGATPSVARGDGVRTSGQGSTRDLPTSQAAAEQHSQAGGASPDLTHSGSTSGYHWSAEHEAQMVLQPLGVTMLVALQLLALERLAECCHHAVLPAMEGSRGVIPSATAAGGSLNSGVSGGEAVGSLAAADNNGADARAGAVGLDLLRASGLDQAAEAVAAAAILRALLDSAAANPPSSHARGPGGASATTAVATLSAAATGEHFLLPGTCQVLLTVGAARVVAAAPTGKGSVAQGLSGRNPGKVKSGAHSVVEGAIGGGSEPNGDSDEALGGALVGALQQAHQSLRELAARLMGLLLAVVSERSQRQRAQHCPEGDGGSGGPAPHNPHGASAYVASLRQALLLVCHLLPCDDVYDKVLHHLACWLTDLPSATAPQRDQHASEDGTAGLASAQLPVGATAPKMSNAGGAAVGDASASAAGSPVGFDERPACDLVRSGTTGIPARVDTTTPVATGSGGVAPAAQAPVSGIPPWPVTDPDMACMLLGLIRDIACQAMSTAGTVDVLDAAAAGATASLTFCGPAHFNTVTLSLRLACASLCEGLAGLVRDMLPWAAREGDLEMASGATATQAAAMPTRHCNAGEGSVLGGEGSGQCERVIAMLSSTVVKIAGMCMTQMDSVSMSGGFAVGGSGSGREASDTAMQLRVEAFVFRALELLRDCQRVGCASCDVL